MSGYDPIRDLTRLGYTEREAAFLFLVCRVSGYFTRSQFNTFLKRKAGGLVQQFVDRLLANRHLRVIECSRNWHIYHVIAPVLYQRIEHADSTSRRLKGDDEIRRRLMILECCIRRPEAKILFSTQAKCEFFADLKIPSSLIPWAAHDREDSSAGAGGDSIRRLPVLISNNAVTAPAISFVFADPGFVTTKRFESYVKVFAPLLRALGTVTLLYACEQGSSVSLARAIVEKKLTRALPANSAELFPYGVEHFLSFLKAERRWATSAPDLSPTDVRLLNEGEQVYASPLHSELRNTNSEGSEPVFGKLAAMGFALPSRISFATEYIDVPRALVRHSGPKERVSQVDLPIGA